MSDNSAPAYLCLQFSVRRYETSTPDPDDPWDRASTSADWTLEAVIGADTDSSVALPNAEGLLFGSPVYVPYVIWSTGDSFGRDEAYDIEVLGYFGDGAAAQKALDDALINDDVYRPWKGFFESVYASGVFPSTVGRKR